MRVFDRFASRSDRAEAEMPGPTRPRAPSLWPPASRDFRIGQKRASLRRALIVLALVAAVCGSAVLMRENVPVKHQAVVTGSTTTSNLCGWLWTNCGP